MNYQTKLQAQLDYEKFFKEFPNQRNPTDLNTPEKFKFAKKIGFQRYRAMQQARKQGEPWSRKHK